MHVNNPNLFAGFLSKIAHNDNRGFDPTGADPERHTQDEIPLSPYLNPLSYRFRSDDATPSETSDAKNINCCDLVLITYSDLRLMGGHDMMDHD